MKEIVLATRNTDKGREIGALLDGIGITLRTLAEFEAVTAYQALTALVDIPFNIFEKGLDVLAGRGRKLGRNEREENRPAEHRASSTAPVDETSKKPS